MRELSSRAPRGASDPLSTDQVDASASAGAIFIWLGISASSVTAISAGTILSPMPRCVAPGSTKFWTPHLSDSDDGLTNLIRDGWFSDTRPPNFNAWATALSSLGVTSIAVGRIASNLPVAGLMVLAALQFARRLPDQADFNSALLLPTLSLPPAMEAFVTCRSHFWQMAAQPVPISAHHSTCQNRNRPKA